MALAAQRWGQGPRIVLVHGFTQSARCWGPLPEQLARDHEVVAVDAPGHGQSSYDEADLAEAAALIGEAGGPGTYLGYSMGGRMCLRLACDRPDLVERLVLVGATAGLAQAAERAQRRRRDEALAARVLEIGVDVFLDEWLALPLFAGLDIASQDRDERRLNRPEGLAGSLRHCGTGAQEPLWDRLSSLRQPVLVVAGALDHKFVSEARHLVASLGGAADLSLIEGAGHSAHREQADLFGDTLHRWLVRAQLAPGSASSAASAAE